MSSNPKYHLQDVVFAILYGSVLLPALTRFVGLLYHHREKMTLECFAVTVCVTSIFLACFVASLRLPKYKVAALPFDLVEMGIMLLCFKKSGFGFLEESDAPQVVRPETAQVYGLLILSVICQAAWRAAMGFEAAKAQVVLRWAACLVLLVGALLCQSDQSPGIAAYGALVVAVVMAVIVGTCVAIANRTP